MALAASVHWTVIGGFRHESQDLRVNVVGKYPIEFEMEERFLDCARRLDRLHDSIGQAVSCLTPVIARKLCRLVHHDHSRCVPGAIWGGLAVKRKFSIAATISSI